MNALRSFIAKSTEEEDYDDDEDEAATLPNLAAVSVNQADTYRYSDSSWSGSDSEEDDDDSDDSDEEDAAGTPNPIPVPLRNDYFARLDRAYWQLEGDTALLVYQNFLKYSPLANCQHQRSYTELDLIGLEYLLSDTGRKVYETLPFPRLHLNALETGKVRPLHTQCRDTFIVDRTMDYVYGRVLELALMHHVSLHRLPQGMDQLRGAYWQRRNAFFPLCRKPQCMRAGEEGERKCHQQLVIYTNTESAFFRTCQAMRDCNPHVDYDKHGGGTTVKQRISFHLVNLLCGPFLDEHGENTVSLYDKWVVVPIDLLDLWNARVGRDLNTTSFSG